MRENKSNTIIKNLTFLFIFIIFIFAICLFNYKIDPYNIFKKQDFLYLNYYPRDLINIAIKNYKGPKIDTVLIGSSDSVSMFGHFYKKYFNMLCMDAINYKQYKDILEYYLKYNPNTKNVIIITGYLNLTNDIYIPLPDFEEKNNKIKEFKLLFLSYETTKNSINIIIENIKNFIFNKNNQNDKFIYKFKPTLFDEFNATQKELDLIEKENLENINNLINFLNRKKINYTIIIPPYNATFLSLIYNNKIYQEKIDNFKRYIVNNTKENTKIYDFAFVNEYTSKNIFENEDILYLNSSHPSYIWGAKIHKILYNNEDKYNNLYFLLNKDNVESIIKKEHILLNKYIKKNEKLINYCKKLSKNYNKETILETKQISEDKMTEEAKNEFKYLINL